jgi:glyoxylase-like metal-dependent hydrolase (beta-lactamase superfamily II)
MLKLSTVSGNTQRLDGGAMFGNAPRALWSRWAPPDELGRVALECRAFLVEDGTRRVLIETGIGVFFPPELRERYGVMEDRHVLLESLAALGLSDADIDVVILSHLHFDHAGGLLAAYREGEGPRLLFPRARFVVGRNAFERAQSPHLRDRASFIPELPALLTESGRLTLIDSPSDASAVLGPSFELVESHGHTPGMMHTRLRGARGTALFAADLVPGRAWVHLPITMGYDRYPELLVDEKRRLLDELREQGGMLLFTHDPECSGSGVALDARGRYAPANDVARLSRWDLDLEAWPNPA